MKVQVHGMAQIQFSISSQETNPQKAIQNIIDKIGDELGVEGVTLKMSCANGEVIELNVDDWNISELVYFDENGMQR